MTSKTTSPPNCPGCGRFQTFDGRTALGHPVYVCKTCGTYWSPAWVRAVGSNMPSLASTVQADLISLQTSQEDDTDV